jgi:hypothetical protein
MTHLVKTRLPFALILILTCATSARADDFTLAWWTIDGGGACP